MAASFEVTSQAGRTINNVGGNQYLHVSQARRRVAAVGKSLALLGLAVGLTSLVALGFGGYATVQDVRAAIDSGSFGAPYLEYAPGYAPVAAISLACGIVVGKIGRVLSL